MERGRIERPGEASRGGGLWEARGGAGKRERQGRHEVGEGERQRDARWVTGEREEGVRREGMPECRNKASGSTGEGHARNLQILWGVLRPAPAGGKRDSKIRTSGNRHL